MCLTFVLGAIAACAPDDGADPPAVGADEQALLNASNAFVPTWETTPPTKGTISSGTYAATQVDDATFEQLSEAKSGSKQLLDHTWKITDVTGAGAFSLSVIATKGQSGGDAFNLTWATATGTGATATCGTFQAFSPACSITAVTPAETTCATTITNPTSVICVKVVDSITGSDATANTVRVDAIALREATAPAAIANLAAGTATASTIPLTWTAPGDDGATGTATSYDVRYATAAITEATWAAATPVTGEPAPGVAGTAQSFTLTGLASATTYYVAVKTTDESGNVAALSNVASATTLQLPDLVGEALTAPATAAPGQVINLAYNAVTAHPQVPWAVLPFALYGCGVSLATPPINVATLDRHPLHRGAAASVQSAMWSLMMVLVSGFAAPLAHDTPMHLALGSFAFWIAGALCLWLGPHIVFLHAPTREDAAESELEEPV